MQMPVQFRNMTGETHGLASVAELVKPAIPAFNPGVQPVSGLGCLEGPLLGWQFTDLNRESGGRGRGACMWPLVHPEGAGTGRTISAGK